jgi:hypothetical protein
MVKLDWKVVINLKSLENGQDIESLFNILAQIVNYNDY